LLKYSSRRLTNSRLSSAKTTSILLKLLPP
jgi:hypothetical protein